MRSLLFPDGDKLILNDKKGTQELYDLKAGPQESRNLIDEPDAKGNARVGRLRLFLQTHQNCTPGYKIPFRG